MGKLDNLDFGGTVESKEADTSGDKLDTSANSAEEQETQDKVENAMENNEDISDDDINVDTSDEDSDDDSDEEEEDEDDSSEDSEDEEEEESESDENVDKNEKFESKDSKEDEQPEKASEESLSKKEVKDLDYSRLKEIENNADLTDEAKEQQVFQTFLNIHKNTIPESARVNFQKFIDSGRNNAFLMADDSLYKLVMEVRKYKDDIPLSERLSSALNTVFRDNVAKNEQRKGEVKAEIRTQKVNKAVSTSTRATSGNPDKNSLNDMQSKAMERMNVSKKDYKKYGNMKFKN